MPGPYGVDLPLSLPPPRGLPAHGYINLTRGPFYLPKPQFQLNDYLAPEPPRKFGLWDRDAIAKALRRQAEPLKMPEAGARPLAALGWRREG